MQLVNTIWADANSLAQGETGIRLLAEAADMMQKHYPGRQFTRATLAGRVMLKSLLPGISWTALITELAYLENGKPFLPEHDLHFNISHSGNMVVLAYSTRPVGADLVDIRCPLHHPDLFMHPAEVNEMNEKTGDERKLYMAGIWARKEAIGKLSGEGWSPAFPKTDTTTAVFHGNKCVSMVPFGIGHHYHGVLAAYDRIRQVQMTAFRFNNSFTHQLKDYAV